MGGKDVRRRVVLTFFAMMSASIFVYTLWDRDDPAQRSVSEPVCLVNDRHLISSQDVRPIWLQRL